METERKWDINKIVEISFQVFREMKETKPK